MTEEEIETEHSRIPKPPPEGQILKETNIFMTKKSPKLLETLDSMRLFTILQMNQFNNINN